MPRCDACGSEFAGWGDRFVTRDGREIETNEGWQAPPPLRRGDPAPSVPGLLRASLSAAVPLWIDEVRGYSHEERMERVRWLASMVATAGDVLQYRSKRQGVAAAAFNRLAEAIACAAFQPSGCEIFGLHFCATTDAAEAPRRRVERRSAADIMRDPTLPSLLRSYDPTGEGREWFELAKAHGAGIGPALATRLGDAWYADRLLTVLEEAGAIRRVRRAPTDSRPLFGASGWTWEVCGPWPGDG